jgi:hypothetical protein
MLTAAVVYRCTPLSFTLVKQKNLELGSESLSLSPSSHSPRCCPSLACIPSSVRASSSPLHCGTRALTSPPSLPAPSSASLIFALSLRRIERFSRVGETKMAIEVGIANAQVALCLQVTLSVLFVRLPLSRERCRLSSVRQAASQAFERCGGYVV